MDAYQTLIDTYRSLDSHPQVILLTPVRCFLTEKNTISPRIIEEEVRPTVERLAYDNELGIINLHNLFGNQWEQSIMPDRLHPSSIGAGAMARKIGDYLLNAAQNKPVAFVPQNTTSFNFHGYQGYDFQLDGVPCKVVRPAKEVQGRPWIWRARFGDMSRKPILTCWSMGFMSYIAMWQTCMVLIKQSSVGTSFTNIW